MHDDLWVGVESALPSGFQWLVGAALFMGATGISAVASADEALLNCSGTYYDYSRPDLTQIAVPSHAALIDFSRNTFEFDWVFLRISKITEIEITLEGHLPGNDAQGVNIYRTIDRVSGHAQILWRTPEEERKMFAGQKATMSAYLDIHCVNSQKQF